MLIGKSFICYTKADRDPVSVLLEIKGKPEILLFESGAIAELCKYHNIVKSPKRSGGMKNIGIHFK